MWRNMLEVSSFKSLERNMSHFLDVSFSLICFFKGKTDETVHNRFNFLHTLRQMYFTTTNVLFRIEKLKIRRPFQHKIILFKFSFTWPWFYISKGILWTNFSQLLVLYFTIYKRVNSYAATKTNTMYTKCMWIWRQLTTSRCSLACEWKLV